MTEQTKHDRIFLQLWAGEDATWSTKRLHEDDVEYIRSDIVAEQLAAKDADSIRVQFLRENTGIDWEWVDRFCFGDGNALLDSAISAIDKELK